MGAKGSVEAAKINAQNWNSLEVSVLTTRKLKGWYRATDITDFGLVCFASICGWHQIVIFTKHIPHLAYIFLIQLVQRVICPFQKFIS